MGKPYRTITRKGENVTMHQIIRTKNRRMGRDRKKERRPCSDGGFRLSKQSTVMKKGYLRELEGKKSFKGQKS